VNSEWPGPDDSLSFRDANGELAGARRVKDAFTEHRIKAGKTSISSKDPDWLKMRDTLEREGMPRGMRQWQIPAGLGPKQDCNCFVGHIDAGTVVPKHHHDVDVFRVVIAGDLKVTIDGETVTLKPGDWILIKAGQEYELIAVTEIDFYYHHP
jgi:mannose-6-phosphate isomerase-like protein (cupin superfamily)